jgi:putative FmdB family regulatory protein
MPTYEYECKTCGHSFEVFQGMKDDPIKVCPQCGKEVRRLINGGTGIIFKGSGFYVTDNKGSGPKETPAKPAKPAGSEAPAAGSAAAVGSPASAGSSATGTTGGDAGKTGTGSVSEKKAAG